MGSPAESLLTAIAIVAALWGAGRPVARWLVPDADPLAGLVWSVALGMLAWQSLLGLTVAGGWWDLAPLSTMTLLGAAWGIIECVAWLAPRFVWPRRGQAREALSPNRIVALLAELFARPPLFGPAILALLATLMICLAPPTRELAPTDALAEAHRLAASGSAQSLAHGLLTPGVGATLLHAWAESIADPGAVCLLNYASGLFFALAIAIIAQPVLGSRHALTAGAIAIITPGVLSRLAFPSNELAPAALLLLAGAAWWRAAVEFGGGRCARSPRSWPRALWGPRGCSPRRLAWLGDGRKHRPPASMYGRGQASLERWSKAALCAEWVESRRSSWRAWRRFLREVLGAWGSNVSAPRRDVAPFCSPRRRGFGGLGDCGECVVWRLDSAC